MPPNSIRNIENLTKMFVIQFIAGRKRKCLVAYLLMVKQRKDKSLKAYLARLNKKRLTTTDQGKKVTLTALLGGIWPSNRFMLKLARRIQTILWKFMDKANDFVNTKDIL